MTEMSTRDNTVAFSEHSIDSSTAEWDRDSEHTPVFAVVSAVGKAANEDPLELPPLHDAIDPEALNDLFTSRPDPAVEKVEFRYAGCDVVVHGDGTVEAQATHSA